MAFLARSARMVRGELVRPVLSFSQPALPVLTEPRASCVDTDPRPAGAGHPHLCRRRLERTWSAVVGGLSTAPPADTALCFIPSSGPRAELAQDPAGRADPDQAEGDQGLQGCAQGHRHRHCHGRPGVCPVPSLPPCLFSRPPAVPLLSPYLPPRLFSLPPSLPASSSAHPVLSPTPTPSPSLAPRRQP